MAAAGLWTTPSDLVTFAQAVKNSYDGVEGAPLSEELAREVLTPQVPSTEWIGGLDALGLGLFLGRDGRIFGHNGVERGIQVPPDGVPGYRTGCGGDDERRQRELGCGEGPRQDRRGARVEDYPIELEERVVPDDAAMAGRVGTYRLRENLGFKVEQAAVGFLVTFDGQSPMPFGAVGGSVM